MNDREYGCSVFFVISGYLITADITESEKQNDIVEMIIKKIKKVVKISTPSILFAFILMKLGLMFNQSMLQYGNQFFFAGQFNNFTPTLGSLIRDIFRVLVINSDYNRPLGFMATSLFGGICTIILAKALIGTDDKNAIKVCTMIYLISVWYYQKISSFYVGSLCYYCVFYIKERLLHIGKSKRIKDSFGVLLKRYLLLFIALYIMTYQDEATGIYTPLRFLISFAPVIRALGVAVFIFWCEIYGERAIKILSKTKLMIFLGNISAYIYSYHWPIILSVGCWLFGLLYELGRGLRTALITMACTILSIVMAYLTNVLFISLKKKGAR
ncbi:acyltransferase family protein [Butyrivibrio sp.]|uniref:acyltransferase family protein n=1 Tax=Butyrivibrio sp. TaxID=28121 RepID=UPI0025BCFC79|nr:acyltransferase family protein [Butyrivibrio sp.]MBE5838014.1 hypothetical protein [Butyrivibrio sp.]